MSRCNHGFLKGVVDCPEGCHGAKRLPRETKRVRTDPSEPRRLRSDAEVIAAIESTGSLAKAARELGYRDHTSLHQRAKVSPAVREAINKHRSLKRWDGKLAHPGMVDMTGQTKGDWSVLRRLPNTANGNAVWLCQRAGCGHEQPIQGVDLRSGNPGCKACKEKG